MVIPEPVSVRAVLEELASISHGLLAGKPVQFDWSVDPDADEIITDRRMLRQILMCLLNNATKFTQSGELGVKVRCKGSDEVEFAVWDTGDGISNEDMELVFEAFKQADASLTRRYDGLGIGLTLAHELVSLMGGKLDLESKVGKGTTVRVCLPLQCEEFHDPQVFGTERKEEAQGESFWALD